MKVKIKIKNTSKEKISIIKEPEAIGSLIDVNDTVEIVTNEEEENIIIYVGEEEDGTIYIQIWDALKTNYVIYHHGKDILEKYL